MSDLGLSTTEICPPPTGLPISSVTSATETNLQELGGALLGPPIDTTPASAARITVGLMTTNTNLNRRQTLGENSPEHSQRLVGCVQLSDAPRYRDARRRQWRWRVRHSERSGEASGSRDSFGPT